MKFRPTLLNLEERANPSGPDVVDPTPGGTPVVTAPTTPPPANPPTSPTPVNTTGGNP